LIQIYVNCALICKAYKVIVFGKNISAIGKKIALNYPFLTENSKISAFLRKD